MRGLTHPWNAALAIGVAWVSLLMLAFLSRHLLAVDETRYVSVAWEMWLRGDLLVPHLNGEPYDHKPPLLFWLIHLAWQLFGVSEMAARLVPAVAVLVGALLVMPLARLLWPRQCGCGPVGAWIVFTLTLWALWTTAMMFDLLVAVCAEIALFGVLTAWRGRAAAGWPIVGLGIGLGTLAKGPVILIYVLPAAFAGKYRGEFNFAGRLQIPLTPLRHGSVASWAAMHPDGLLVHRTEDPPGPDATGIHSWQTYRSDYLVLRDVSSWSLDLDAAGN